VLNVVEGVPFQALVATFADIETGAGSRTAADFAAAIDWGDGQASPGTIVPLGNATYGVVGAHTYEASGAFQVSITIVNRVTGRADTAESQAFVADVPVTLIGRLNPASDTGVSSSDAITNINQPNFLGTTDPGATVRLFAQAAGTVDLVPVGQVVAGADGAWSITTSPLTDGAYIIFAMATEAVGGTTATLQVLPGPSVGPLVIDTLGPRVTSLEFDPGAATVRLVFRDERSGLDATSLADASSFRLARGSSPIPVTNLTTQPAASPTDPQRVAASFAGRRLRGTDLLLRVASGGIRDVAGNALDGEFFGYFPSGDSRSGGDFLARLDFVHGTTFPAQSVVLPAAARFPHRARRRR
jgi:hypothetical protein